MILTIDMEISNHHHFAAVSAFEFQYYVLSVHYQYHYYHRRNVNCQWGKFGGSAEIEAVQKTLNKSLHQSKSRAQGTGSGDWRAFVDRDQLSQSNPIHHLLLLCLYLIPLLQSKSSLCFFAHLFPHTTDNGRLLSIHRLMETRQ